MAFNIDDYVDVATRLQEFYDRYPDGSIVTRDIEILDNGVLAIADAYRTADDKRPGRGTAWEPIPGKTSFTKDSEVQNAETAAWGRAIIAVGIPSKKIASAEEVRARQPDRRPAARARRASTPTASSAAAPHTPYSKRIVIAAKEADIDDDLRYRLTRMFSGVTSSKDVPPEKVSAVVAAMNWYHDHPESLRELEAWEQLNGIKAA